MNELDYIINEWDLADTSESPIVISGKGRVDLAHMFKELGYKSGAEIGTFKGGFAYSLCKANRKAKLYCVDPWKVYDEYGDVSDQEQMDANHQKAIELLKPYNVQYVYEYSMDALAQFDDESLDYVYIDANHEWQYITQDIYYWAQKVRVGGIVSGDDYLFGTKKSKPCHVRPAVTGYTDAFDIKPWFLLSKVVHPEIERSMSWFWVKA